MPSSSIPQGHKGLTERKATGAHYTPPQLARFMAEQVFKYWKGKDKNSLVTILDPAVGDGQLIKSLLDVLLENGYENIRVRLYDTDAEAIKHCRRSLENCYPMVSFVFYQKDFLEDLLNKERIIKHDLIISNPPYVRPQAMGADVSQRIAKEFKLSGSLDLAHAFIVAGEMSLKKGGKSAFVVSNRLMSTKGSWAIREYIKTKICLDHMWDFGDSRLFEAAVLPLVFVGSVGKQKKACPLTSIYTDTSISPKEAVVGDLFDYLHEDQCVSVGERQYRITQGELLFGEKVNDIWTQKTAQGEQWLAQVDRFTFCRFADINKISVGIKSTADKVFIKQDWLGMPKDERPEMLKPLITHYEAAQYRPKRDASALVLYTHEIREGQKRVIELETYPKTKAFLEKHSEVLKARKYLQESKTRRWYELWVAHDPGKWKYPKIVFRDISVKPLFWLDTSGAVVNGDCYWLSSQGLENLDLIYLALAVANSPFIEKYYDAKFNNKLYSGRRRFISQYVKKFPLPDPQSECGQAIIALVKNTYESGDFDDQRKKEINSLVNQAFGLEKE
ncbi:N-6 DNA methylase [Lentisphaera profundi]|uniref:site-specific DNA-methyltransferase (adenine-specific) n=1 Tax=Lentisphaera profundi TaxID=1658616 RepID=A0ABY7VWT9_9BACT|nr:N-6 DNA methylase [Lentisphaera profundi]WDE97660.1 N-6 DNA methylase [Lentisphaera profundi]